MRKRYLLVACCLFAAFAAVHGAGRKESPAAGPQEESRRIITDHLGNEVSLPREINRIVISSILPLPSVYCLFEGDAKKLVGMHPSSMAAAKNSILPDIMPDIVNVNTQFVTGSDINIEEVIKLKPDVAFYLASSPEEGEKYRQVGIPAVAFSTTKWNFNSIDTFNGWVELLGRVLNKESQATGIVEYGNEVYRDIRSRLDAAGLGEAQKPRVMIIFRHHNGQIRTIGKTHFGQWWVDSTGGINVGSELQGTPEVNMEQIYRWNPDIIYLTNFTRVMPEDLLTNTVSGQDWSGVQAVKKGQVYKFPLGMYRWYPPASDTPLVLMWLAKHEQPELFAHIDMEKEVRAYYKRFYRLDLSDDQVRRIFNPSRDAADE
jgi:iron complex transport system substrate-binding protein